MHLQYDLEHVERPSATVSLWYCLHFLSSFARLKAKDYYIEIGKKFKCCLS